MIKIEIGPRLLKTLRELGPEVTAAAESKLGQVAADFGKPHSHTRLGLRKIGHRSYEARIGLQWRIVLVEDVGRLLAYDVLNHDGVRRWLKSTK